MIARHPDADRPLLALLDEMDTRAGNDQAVEAVLRKVGRPKAGEGNGANSTVSRGSTQAAYLAARLRRDHPDAVFDESVRGSVRKAAIAAGIVHDAQGVPHAPAAEPTASRRPGALEAIATPARRRRGPQRPAAPAAGPITVAELLRRYAVRRRLSARTVRLYGFTIDHFSRFLDHEPTVDDLDDEIVSAFLLWRADQPCRGGKVAAASVEKDRVQILAVWRYGARKRLVAEFPDVAAWRVPKRVKPAYTVDDMERLIAAARALRGDARTTGGMPRAWWFATLLLAAFQTGERKGGLLGLRWRDVDLDRCLVTFRAENRKGGREDLVRGITPALAAELRQHQGDTDAPVWPWCGNATGLYAPLKALCRRAGVTYHALHGIRRTSASYVARGGGDATAHLGHSSPTVTRDHYLVGEIVQARAGLEFLPRIGEEQQ